MANQVKVLYPDLSDGERSARMWSKLTKRSVSVSEAKDLDLTFSGAPANPFLGEEPMSPIQDDDEEPRSNVLTRDGSRANTNRTPLAR